MPSLSKAMQHLMGACSHGAHYKKCPKHMTREQMREYAATSTKGLPERKRRRR